MPVDNEVVMRDPRPGIAWSRRRVDRRVAYATWMASDAWLAHRRRWRAAWITVHGELPTCAICGERWTLRCGDLHHRTYDRLGHEHFADLVPLCRPCHTVLHRIIESSPAWRKLGRPRATAAAIALLRRRIREGEP